MPTSAAADVRRYLAAQPPDARRRLKRIREIIRAVTPRAVETFSYGIPGFRLDGKVYLYYAGFRKHVSLYPMVGSIQKTFAKQLAGLKTAKGTIQFPLDEPLPEALIRKLVKARAADVVARTS